MKKRELSPEERAEKEEELRAKQRARLQKHVVICPHCGGEALDHMTKCPCCGGELQPAGYRPLKESTRKKIRIVTYTIGAAVAIAIVVMLVFLKK